MKSASYDSASSSSTCRFHICVTEAYHVPKKDENGRYVTHYFSSDYLRLYGASVLKRSSRWNKLSMAEENFSEWKEACRSFMYLAGGGNVRGGSEKRVQLISDRDRKSVDVPELGFRYSSFLASGRRLKPGFKLSIVQPDRGLSQTFRAR